VSYPKTWRKLFPPPLRTPSHAKADADEELRAFLDERADDLVAHGISPDDARREALRRLGASIDDAASHSTIPPSPGSDGCASAI